MSIEDTNKTVEVLADLAMEMEKTDPNDWTDADVDPKKAYAMMASNVIEQFDGVKKEQHMTVALATITKLLVENFLLNVKLRK